MVLGLRARLDPPPAAPIRQGLLSPGGAPRADEGDDRWQGGFAWLPLTCDVTGPRPIVCAEGDLSDGAKTPPTGADVVEYDPVYLIGGDYCSTLDVDRDRVGRARGNLAATESWQLEQELWDGVAARMPTAPLVNNYLAKAGPDGAEVLADDPVPFVNALAELEQAMAECLHGQQGMVHAVPEVVELWQFAGVVRLDGQRLLTGLDNIVIAGSGYSGSAPGADEGDDPVPPADLALASNIYGTSLVYVRLGAVVEVGDEASQVARTTNDWTVLVERAAAATFDPCCWFTIPVDHTTDIYSSATP